MWTDSHVSPLLNCHWIGHSQPRHDSLSASLSLTGESYTRSTLSLSPSLAWLSRIYLAAIPDFFHIMRCYVEDYWPRIACFYRPDMMHHHSLHDQSLSQGVALPTLSDVDQVYSCGQSWIFGCAFYCCRHHSVFIHCCSGFDHPWNEAGHHYHTEWSSFAYWRERWRWWLPRLATLSTRFAHPQIYRS